MSRTSLIAVLVFAAGLGSGYFVQSAAGVLQRRTHAADVAAIEELNQEDIEATLTRDPKRLMDLWAENAVAFYPGSPPAVGRQAIEAHKCEIPRPEPGLEGVELHSKLRNLRVEDGLAGAWYEKAAEYKLSPESSPVSWHSKGLMV